MASQRATTAVATAIVQSLSQSLYLKDGLAGAERQGVATHYTQVLLLPSAHQVLAANTSVASTTSAAGMEDAQRCHIKIYIIIIVIIKARREAANDMSDGQNTFLVVIYLPSGKHL